MVAQIFTDITHFAIRVVWSDTTTGYVNGNKFAVVDGIVTFPNHPTFNKEYDSVKKPTRNLAINLGRAIALTPEFSDAKRESKSLNLEVTNGNFPGLFQVHNPLNGSIYNVVLHPNKTFCECPDHQFRKIECKHLKAVKSKQPQPVPVIQTYTGKARSQGRIKSNPDLDITQAQYEETLKISRQSLGI